MSHELQLEVKVRKASFEEQDEEDMRQAEADRIIGKVTMPEIDLDNEDKYEYRRIVIKLADLMGRGDFDGRHTVLYLPYGTYMAKVGFDKFNLIYEAMTGIQIKKISDYQFVGDSQKRSPQKD